MPIPPWSICHTNLREILTGLYDEKLLAKQVAKDAGLDWGSINTDGQIRSVWHAVVDEARKQGCVQTIIEIAAKKYPQLAEELRQTMKADRPSVESPFNIRDAAWKSEVSSDQQERIIGKQSTLLPIGFLEQGLERARSVARIVTASGESGTGFLVGGNLIVTNNHVLQDEAVAATATFQFNFEQSVVGLDKPIETVKCRPDLGFLTSKDHDWTVVRLEGDVNAKWGAIPLVPATIAKEDRVIIIQHPGGGQKQIALAHNLVTYADDQIVQYLTDTMPGSSGSPVFNEQWQVVALHHSGGWLREPGAKELLFRNEGTAVGQLLTGAKELLGA